MLVSTLGQGSPCCSVLGQSLNMSPCPVVLLHFFIHWSSPGLFWFSLFLFPVGVHFIATIGMEVGCILFIHVHVYLAVHSKIIIDEKSLVWWRQFSRDWPLPVRIDKYTLSQIWRKWGDCKIVDSYMIKFRINFVISLISMAHVHNVCLDREISWY